MDILIKITDRKGITHELKFPVDMALNLMLIVRAYELEPIGTIEICIGMAMCYSCQCYVGNEVNLPQKRAEEVATLSRLLQLKSNSHLSCQIPLQKNWKA